MKITDLAQQISRTPDRSDQWLQCTVSMVWISGYVQPQC